MPACEIDRTLVDMQALLSAAFGLATMVTLLNANGLLLLQLDQLDLSPSSVLSALPGTLLFFLLLGAPSSLSSFLVFSRTYP